MRSIRNNKGMVSALLADYKDQQFQEEGFPEEEEVVIVSPAPYRTIYENRYDNRFESNDKRYERDRFESNEIKRWVAGL